MANANINSSSPINPYTSNFSSSSTSFNPFQLQSLLAITLPMIDRDMAKRDGTAYFNRFLHEVFTLLRPAVSNSYFRHHLLYILTGEGTQMEFTYTSTVPDDGQLRALHGDGNAIEHLKAVLHRKKMQEVMELRGQLSIFDQAVSSKLVTTIDKWGKDRLELGSGLGDRGVTWTQMIIDGDPAEIRDVLGQLYCNEGERFSKSRVAETTRKFHSTVYTPSNSFAVNVETAKRNANEMFEAHRRNGSTCPTTEKDVVEKIIMEMGGHYSEARTDINMGNTPRDPTNLAKRLEEPTTYGGLINVMIA